MKLSACPDVELISAYLDGEVAERWATEIAQHVKSCRRCQHYLRGFQQVSHSLLEDREPDVRSAASLVWTRLDVARGTSPPSAFWRRFIGVPAPVVFAAMVTLLLLAGALAARMSGQRRLPLAAAGSGLGDARVTSEGRLAASLEEIERIIGGLNAAAGPVVIELPRESQFYAFGRPAILRQDELLGTLQ